MSFSKSCAYISIKARYDASKRTNRSGLFHTPLPALNLYGRHWRTLYCDWIPQSHARTCLPVRRIIPRTLGWGAKRRSPGVIFFFHLPWRRKTGSRHHGHENKSHYNSTNSHCILLYALTLKNTSSFSLLLHHLRASSSACLPPRIKKAK